MHQFNRLFTKISIEKTILYGWVLFACLYVPTVMAAKGDDFVTTWKTDNPGTSNATSITVPMVGGTYEVDWDNDGVSDQSGLTGSVTHDFGVTGTYTIRIRGTYNSISIANADDKEKIIDVVQWGTNAWTSMAIAYWGASNLLVTATDTPDFSLVTSMAWMFKGASLANPDTSGWDTSAVTDMTEMFQGATSANPDTSSWDTSEVTNMTKMFSGATSATPDTSSWDTAKVTSMWVMFGGASSANPDTSNWNTAAVTNMSSMFSITTLANPDTSNWNTALVTNMSSMFSSATSANPDTSNWDTSKVTNMRLMFSSASSANPDTTNWDTSAVSNMQQMFGSTASVNPDTSNWDTSAVTNMSNMFIGATSANPDTSGWDTSAVTTMAGMFLDATSANPDTSSWDTAAVTNMSLMFRNATSANPGTSSWNTAAVTDMSNMFEGATAANPNTSGWDTSALTDTILMFSNAVSFDRNIGSWNVTSLTSANNMFNGVTLSPSNYANLLTGWNAQTLQSGVVFNGGNSTYCSASASTAKANMIATDSWAIDDGGADCSASCSVDVITDVTDTMDALYEACEILSVGLNYTAENGANISLSAGWEVTLEPDFTIEVGATLDVQVCGQSLCMTSPSPMPDGCHSCVVDICNLDPSCCDTEYDQTCVDRVDSVCGLVCE